MKNKKVREKTPTFADANSASDKCVGRKERQLGQEFRPRPTFTAKLCLDTIPGLQAKLPYHPEREYPEDYDEEDEFMEKLTSSEIKWLKKCKKYE